MACTSSMLPRRNWTPFQAVDNSATGGRRSKTRTSWPSASAASTTWLPRNPDPPTTRDRTIASTDAGRNQPPQHSSLLTPSFRGRSHESIFSQSLRTVRKFLPEVLSQAMTSRPTEEGSPARNGPAIGEGPSENRLHPTIRDRNYLHLAPIA